jgi:hypothetical protein
VLDRIVQFEGRNRFIGAVGKPIEPPGKFDASLHLRLDARKGPAKPLFISEGTRLHHGEEIFHEPCGFPDNGQDILHFMSEPGGDSSKKGDFSCFHFLSVPLSGKVFRCQAGLGKTPSLRLTGIPVFSVMTHKSP